LRYRTGIFTTIIIVMYLSVIPWDVEAYEDSPNITSLVDSPLSYREWYEHDRAYAQDTARLLALDPDRINMTLLMEWQELARETAYAFSSAYQDPQGLFSVYSANNTGKIHVLALARYYRELILKEALAGKIMPLEYPGYLQGGLPEGIPSLSREGFTQGDELQPYTVTETVTVIHDIDISGSPFKGVVFYLLPFRISGYEGAAYTMNTPGRDEAVYLSASSNPNATKLAVLVSHELGHIIHYQFMGTYDSNPGAWERFINLMGETEYHKFGSYTQKTDEKFAECFRMAYGSSLGRQGRRFHDDLPDPFDDKPIKAYRSLVDDLLSKGDENYFDVQRIEAALIDYQGQPLCLPVGPRPEQINTIITNTPDIIFTAPLALKGKEHFVPVGACYNTNIKPKIIDFSYLTNNEGVVHYKLNLPEQGLYTVYLGREAEIGLTDTLKFQILYVN
jgi:hypothetical protein